MAIYSVNPFQPSVAFYIETSYLICRANRMTGFYMKCNTGLKWVNFISLYRDGICPLFGTHNTSFYPDKFAARQLRQLVVACENKENGCTWNDILGNYEVKNKLLKNLFYFILVGLSKFP